MKVILGDQTATGTGSRKKQAKHAAARELLDKLDGCVPAPDGQAPLPPVTDTANGQDAPDNMVGALQELCIKKSNVADMASQQEEDDIAKAIQLSVQVCFTF